MWRLVLNRMEQRGGGRYACVCVCVWGGGGIKVLKASAEGDESASGGRLLHLPVVQGKDSFLYKGIADR